MDRKSMKSTQNNQKPEPNRHIGSLSVGPLAYRIKDDYLPLDLINHAEDFRQIKNALKGFDIELKV